MTSVIRFAPRPGYLDALRRAPALGSPALDVYETDEAIVVKADVAGVNPDDIEITVLGDTLRLKGEVKAEQATEGKDYLYRERSYGEFVRVVSLPSNVLSDKATAEFENGTLTLTLPKSEESKPKTITVHAKD